VCRADFQIAQISSAHLGLGNVEVGVQIIVGLLGVNDLVMNTSAVTESGDNSARARPLCNGAASKARSGYSMASRRCHLSTFMGRSGLHVEGRTDEILSVPHFSNKFVVRVRCLLGPFKEVHWLEGHHVFNHSYSIIFYHKSLDLIPFLCYIMIYMYT
jgi:hypothetical protein